MLDKRSLNLVDLAGSERIIGKKQTEFRRLLCRTNCVTENYLQRRFRSLPAYGRPKIASFAAAIVSGATGDQLKEAQEINKSLSTLGDVSAPDTTSRLVFTLAFLHCADIVLRIRAYWLAGDSRRERRQPARAVSQLEGEFNTTLLVCARAGM
jgi:hypothetical protein